MLLFWSSEGILQTQGGQNQSDRVWVQYTWEVRNHQEGWRSLKLGIIKAKKSSCLWVSWDLTYRRRVWSLVSRVQRALRGRCRLSGEGEKGNLEDGQSFFFVCVCVSHSKKKPMKPRAGTSAATAGWGWGSCAAVLRRRLCCRERARPPRADAEAAHRRFDRKGWRVINLTAPGSFFKCSHKSLFVLKSWKVWLSYEFNFNRKTFWLFPSNARTQTCTHVMAGAELRLSGPVHVTCNAQGHNHGLSNLPSPQAWNVSAPSYNQGLPKLPQVALRSPYLSSPPMDLIALTGDWQTNSSKEWVCSRAGGGQRVGTWQWDTAAWHIPEYERLCLIFLAEGGPISPSLAWESPVLRIRYRWLQLLGKGLGLQNCLQGL